MSSFKWRNEDCNKSFANANNRLRHEKKFGHLPKRKNTFIVPAFDKSKGYHIHYMKLLLFISNVA